MMSSIDNPNALPPLRHGFDHSRVKHRHVRRRLAALLVAALVAVCPLLGGRAFAQSATSPTAGDGRNDWSFLVGTWRTHYRLLRHRLARDGVWYSCHGTSMIRSFWQRQGNLEDGDLTCPHRYIGGMTLRLYAPATHQWSIWWGTRKLGVVPPPQVGAFDANGVGNFYARDVQEGKHVIVRFRWTHARGVPHFEQAFSPDDGVTWETNWTTDYERVPVTTSGVWSATESSADGHGFDFLLGTWRTHYRRLRHPLTGDRTWYACQGSANVRAFWAGRGNLEDGDIQCPSGDSDTVTLRVFDASTKRWQLWFGTKKAGLLTPPQIGSFDARGFGVFLAPDTWHGKRIIVRYAWTSHGNHPYFEQAFSTDGGKTWETNWTTTYTRQ